MLRRHDLFWSLLLFASVVAACGGGDDEPVLSGADPAAAASGDGVDTDADGAAEGSEPDGAEGSEEAAASADCSALTVDDVGEFSLAAQLLAQVIGPEQVEALGSEALDYSPDDTSDLLARMHTVLDGRPAEGFDDPREAIAFYEDLNERLRALLAAPAPVSQELVDEYVAASGGLPDSLGPQLPIGAALSAHCPELV
ncbi:MAG: hypothetical protein ACFCVK_00800 [Acidimicrobiales bacterium]